MYRWMFPCEKCGFRVPNITLDAHTFVRRSSVRHPRPTFCWDKIVSPANNYKCHQLYKKFAPNLAVCVNILLQSREKGRVHPFSPPFLAIYGSSGGLAIRYIHPAKSGHETSVNSEEQSLLFKVTWVFVSPTATVQLSRAPRLLL